MRSGKPVNTISIATRVVHVRPRSCGRSASVGPRPCNISSECGPVVPVAASLQGLDGEVVLTVLDDAIVHQPDSRGQLSEKLHLARSEVPAKNAWSDTVVQCTMRRARTAA